MKRIVALCAALLVGGIFASEASAQQPVYAGGGSGEFAPSPYGWHPGFQRFVWKHGGYRCGKPNLFGKLFGSNSGEVPGAQSGTLVFPNHQFARSPRDFFMMDQ